MDTPIGLVIERDEWDSPEYPYTVWAISRPDGYAYDVHDAIVSTVDEATAKRAVTLLDGCPDPIRAVFEGKLDNVYP